MKNNFYNKLVREYAKLDTFNSRKVQAFINKLNRLHTNQLTNDEFEEIEDMKYHLESLLVELQERECLNQEYVSY